MNILKMAQHTLIAIIIFFLTIVCSSKATKNDLVCYQCQSQNLEECAKPKYLKACPNDQAYDRCETILDKKGPNMNATVTKKCSLAPCTLNNAAKALTQQCDMSQDQYSCSSCCAENGCNNGHINWRRDKLIWLLVGGLLTYASSISIHILIL